jgi:hypothetical protein
MVSLSGVKGSSFVECGDNLGYCPLSAGTPTRRAINQRRGFLTDVAMTKGPNIRDNIQEYALDNH